MDRMDAHPVGQLARSLVDRYRVERELGAGGMATVYLAHDLKHDRKVALKVLKPELAAVLGAERFVAEIKTTASLQHPNILPLFDSGEADGFLYYVMPFIDGETLRARLDRETQLGIDEAVNITREVAGALDYAHRHGVIHRDIKPENILLHDGRPMVADFGIALAVSAAAGGRMTETGLSLGTPHYMSPEQATAAKEITARSDIYSLGSVLYEMLTGDPPHTGASAQQIIMKIVTEEAAPVTKLRKSVPPNVAAAVAKALERLPADRFEHAKDFADALENPAFGAANVHGAAVAAGPSRRNWPVAAALVAGVVLASASARLGLLRFVTGGSSADNALDRVSFTQRTFGTEAVFTARFSRDGETIVYSAATEGSVPRLYVIRSDYPEPRPVGDTATQLLSVSSRDELAVLVRASYVSHRLFTGTLARMPMGGGAPREILADVREADWAPDGSDLAIIHRVAGEDRLEYPIGTTLYQSAGYLSDLRFSRAGDRIAFFEHPSQWDDRGGVAVVDLKGHHRMLTDGYWGLEGLAWSLDGKRILFGGALEGGFYQIHSVTLGGVAHLILPSAGTETVQDVSAAGRWLVTRDDAFKRLMAKSPGAQAERDLSWLDNSSNLVISRDGKLLAFEDEAADAGANYAVMIRKTDGSPATRLGEGGVKDLSTDTKWVLSVIQATPQKLMLYPTGPGQSRLLDHGEFESYTNAAMLPDGKNLIVCGNEPAHAARCYVRPIDAGPRRPITPEGTSRAWVSPDGSAVLSQTADGSFAVYSLDGSAPRPISGLAASDVVVRWSPDGKAVWVTHANEIPFRVEQVDLASGRRAPLLSGMRAGRPGLLDIESLTLADDGQSYAYIGSEYVSHIFEVRGMR
jgi:protein kinase-like protein